MAGALVRRGLRLVSNRTESHMMLIDLRGHNITGKDAERVLGDVCITCNKNSIPNDPQKPVITSGIRLGSPAITTRGFGVAEARLVGELVADVIQAPGDTHHLAEVREKVRALCDRFPVYR
jgi:glycine hydroxymethyltransferase